jgi:GTP-binding protein Era
VGAKSAGRTEHKETEAGRGREDGRTARRDERAGRGERKAEARGPARKERPRDEARKERPRDEARKERPRDEARKERPRDEARKERPRDEARKERPRDEARTARSQGKPQAPKERRDERREAERRSPQQRKPERRAPETSGPRRSGTVAIIGRPNVGKSTLLNTALEQPLAIVSPTPQTTREALLGVVRHGAAEIALLDTPGLHKPRTRLGRVMNESARDAAKEADVIVFVTDLARHPDGRRRRRADEEDAPILLPHPGDLEVLAGLPAEAPVVLVVNKVDLLGDKRHLLPLLEAYAKLRSFAAVVPISALREDGVVHVLDEVAKLLPEGEHRFDTDEVTDRPARYFAAEYVREQILRATQEEVPHATAVSIERFLEPATANEIVHIDATIHVERAGQKKILIGAGGEMLKRIGTAARQRIEELLGHRVHLKLWVRVTPDWRDSKTQLEEFGYGKKGTGDEPSYVIVATREGDQADGADEDTDDLDEEDLDEDEEDLDEDEEDLDEDNEEAPDGDDEEGA